MRPSCLLCYIRGGDVVIYEMMENDSFNSIVQGYQSMHLIGDVQIPNANTRGLLSTMGLQIRNMALPAIWLSAILKKIFPEQKDEIMNMTLAESPEFTYQQLLRTYDKEPDSVQRKLSAGPREIICSAMLYSESTYTEKNGEKMKRLRDTLLQKKIPTKIIYEYLLAYSMHLMRFSPDHMSTVGVSLPTTVTNVGCDFSEFTSPAFIRKIMYENIPFVAIINLTNMARAAEIRELNKVRSNQTSLEEAIAIWKGKASNYERQIREADKARLDAMRDAALKYEATIKSQKEEIDRLNQQLQSAEGEVELRDMQIDSLTEQLDDREDDFDDVELPEENILVVGGHDNWVNKLKEIHPKWSFVKIKDKSSPFPQSPICILMFTNHLSHTHFRRVRAFYKDQKVPILFVTCVNLSMLDKQIKGLYKTHVLKV